MFNNSSLKNKLLFTTALTTSIFSYHRSQAACSGSSGTYSCSGSNSSALTVSADDATISTVSGFGVSLSAGSSDAITISGDGAISFTDNNASSITNEAAVDDVKGIDIRSTGDTTNTGSVNVNINSDITATISNNATYDDDYDAIGLLVRNIDSSGDININLSGNITADDGGIDVSGGSTASSIFITVSADSLINTSATGSDSGSEGILTSNGSGANTTLDIAGDISANDYGIKATAGNGSGDMLITTRATSSITSNDEGIRVNNQGSSTTLNLFGDITSTNSAIDIDAQASGAQVTINGGSTISGDIGVQSHASSAMDLTLSGLNGSSVSLTGSTKAVEFGDETNSLTIVGNVTIDGGVYGGSGTDTLTLNNANLTLANSDSDFLNFETITITGDNLVTGDLELGTQNPTGTGTLKVNGTISATSLEVGSGLTIGGANTFTGALTVNSGGTIAPGNSVGTINVTGNVIFETGSNFDVEIDSTGTDLLAVTGNVTLESGVNLKTGSIGFASGSGTILTATGTLDGSFGSVIENGNNVSTFYTPAANSLALINLNTSVLGSQLQTSLNSSILFNDTLNDQIAQGAFVKGRHFWVRNINRNRNVSISEANVGFETRSNGIAIGAQMDIKDNPDYKLGFSLSRISNNNKTNDNLGRKSDDATFASIYGIHNRDVRYKGLNAKLFTSLSLGVGYHDNDSSRTVYNSGSADYATSTPEDFEYNINVQAGLKTAFKNNYYLMPRLSASYIRIFGGGFEENNGGVSAIKLNDYDFTSLKTRQSVRFGKVNAKTLNIFNQFNLTLSPYAEIGLTQEQAIGNRSINGQFSTGTFFNANLENNNRNFTTIALGTNAKINEDISAFINYESANSNDENRSELRGGLRIKF